MRKGPYLRASVLAGPPLGQLGPSDVGSDGGTAQAIPRGKNHAMKVGRSMLNMRSLLSGGLELRQFGLDHDTFD